MTNKRDIWNRCQQCGRFIAYDDFDKGAIHEMNHVWDYYSDVPEEVWETYCKECNKEEATPNAQ